jgi:RHS repeat-associated protein
MKCDPQNNPKLKAGQQRPEEQAGAVRLRVLLVCAMLLTAVLAVRVFADCSGGWWPDAFGYHWCGCFPPDYPPCTDDCSCPPGNNGPPGSPGPLGSTQLPLNQGPTPTGTTYGSCGPGCTYRSTQPGMPVWWVSEPALSIWLKDIPFQYQPGKGPAVSFELYSRDSTIYAVEDEIASGAVASLGGHWYSPWLCYARFDGATWTFFNGVGGAVAFDGFSNPDQINYRSFWSATTDGNGTPIIQYADGRQDEFGVGYTDGNGNVRQVLTKRKDIAGKYLAFSYTQTDGVVYLNSIRDADAHVVTFTYTNANNHPRIAGVSDDYGHSVTLSYDENGLLTSVTDAAELVTSFEYFLDPLGTALQKVITPYGTNVFSHVMQESDNHGVLVDEKGLARHFFLYQASNGIGPTSYADYCPSTANGSVFAFANTFDTEDVNLRNTYYWNPRQYEYLPEGFRANLEAGSMDLSALDVTNYAQARQRHWLLDRDTLYSTGQTLSLERAPSPDGTTQGQITWYDYADKPDPETEGSMIQPRFAAWKLPNGESRFFYYLRNHLGHATNSVETYNDPQGNLKVRTNAFVYAANNFDLQSVTNAAGVREAYNIYNATHQVATNRNALGEDTIYSYDSSNRLVSITRPTGLVTTNLYGADGFLREQRDVGVRTNFYLWASGLLQVHTNELGLVVTNTYDGLNRLRKITYPDGTCVSNGYSYLDLTAVVDQMGFTNRYEFDRLRHMTRKIDALNRTNTYSYCTCGTLESITDPLTNSTTFTYDLAGRLVLTSYPDGYWVSQTFDLMDRLIGVADAAGNSVTNWYNNQGLLLTSSNSVGRLAAYEYDVLDRPTKAVDAHGVEVDTTYEDLGRVLTRTYPDNGVEHFIYTADVSGPTSYTNQVGNTTLYAYDPAGRKTNEVSVGITTNRFSYNPAGGLLTLTDGKNQTTGWVYDPYGRVTNKVDTASNLMFVYGYDPNGRLTNRWTPAKLTTVYKYDPVGNLTNIVYPVSSNISLAYDGLNRLTTMVDGVGTTTYGYDAVGQLLSEDGPWADDTVSYTYNNRLRGSLSVLAPNASAWTESYGYDTEKRLTSVTSPAGYFSYAYDALRSTLPAKLSLPNGAYITNSYDNVARLLSTVLKSSGQSTINSHSYQLNSASQRTQQVFTAGDYVNYTYDSSGQLTVATGKESGGTTNRLNEQLGYAYDPAGNLNYRTNNALLQTFSVNDLNELTTANRSGTMTVEGTTTSPATNVTINTSNAILYADYTFAATNFTLANGTNIFTAIAKDSYGRTDTNVSVAYLPSSISFTYDQNGNLTNDGRRSFFYDDENQLVRVVVTNGAGSSTRSDFAYDGKMRRRIRTECAWSGSTWVTNQVVRYVYDGNLVIQERDANNLPQVAYTRGSDLSGSLESAGGIGGLLARTDLSTINSLLSTAFYHCDGNGNITCLINANQAIVARYLYDPYGNILSQSGPLADPNLYRFSSKEFHVASGLVYYLYRFYKPSLQRWVNRDPIGEAGAANLYAFVGNAPMVVLDIDGLDWWPPSKWPFWPKPKPPTPAPAPPSGPQTIWIPGINSCWTWGINQPNNSPTTNVGDVHNTWPIVIYWPTNPPVSWPTNPPVGPGPPPGGPTNPPSWPNPGNRQLF